MRSPRPRGPWARGSVCSSGRAAFDRAQPALSQEIQQGLIDLFAVCPQHAVRRVLDLNVGGAGQHLGQYAARYVNRHVDVAGAVHDQRRYVDLSMSARQSVYQVATDQTDAYGEMFVAICQLFRNASSLIRVPRFSSVL